MKTFLMKNRILTSIALAALISSEASAALTGNITIQGSVSAATSIIVSSVAGYNSLNLHANQTNLSVANVTEQNNTTAGYTVTLSSANAGKLKNGSLGEINYTARYNGTSVALTVSPVTITTQGAQTSVVNSVKGFDISYTGVAAENLMVGTYSDQLTFTIAAN